jgi:fructan beta-fructosidase
MASSGPSLMQTATLYNEPFRPKFHFSPPQWWANDPNGLVYLDGEYHLFYQYHPEGLTWGPMHWGHAISADLIHWENLPIALFPDDIGTIFSGSVVIDAYNTSGLVPDGGMIAVYSYNTQTQGIAYSTDNGRTWIKYDGNPVINALAKDFRDPKVFWHDPTNQWIVAIAAGSEIQFFASPNLIDWKYISTFTTDFFTMGVWEMPDLFPLEFNGETRWLLLVSVSSGAPAGGSGTMYFIGDFDGERFAATVTNDILWLDFGPDNYAGTTWNNAPDGERIFIAWMNNWRYAEAIPTSPWRGAMTFPRQLSLVETIDGVRLAQQPVKSIESLRELVAWQEDALVEGEMILEDVQGRTLEIIADFEFDSATSFGMQLHRDRDTSVKITYDVAQDQLTVDRPRHEALSAQYPVFFAAPLKVEDGRVQMRILLDESSVEIFANDGEVSITSQQFIDSDFDNVALFANNGTVRLVSLAIYTINSVWHGDE